MARDMMHTRRMLLPRSATPLTRDEAARVLSLAPSVIDALISSGAVLCHVDNGRGVIPPEQLEAFFRDGLLRLYHAQATAADAMKASVPAPAPPSAAVVSEKRVAENDPELTIEIESTPAAAQAPASPEEAELIVTRSIAEFEQEKAEAELRLAPRYLPRRRLGGTFDSVRFTILQMSTTGLRIRHDDALRAGTEGRLTFSIMNPAQSFLIRARVVWTSIAQRGDDAAFCISGLRVIEHQDRMARAIDALRDARELTPDARSSRRRTNVVPPEVSGLTDDQVASIIRAVRKFAADPTEARRWYARARFAVVDDTVRRAAPTQARAREEVLGIWEYLDRRVDIAAISGVLTWMRNSRATAM